MAAFERGAIQSRAGSIRKNNVAAQHPDKITALQKRVDELAKQSEKPLFLVDQFKVVTKGLNGKPMLPIDEDFADIEEP